MPYSIRKNGSRYCLYLKDSGKKLGCHASKAEAEAQRKAIEISKHAMRHLTLSGAIGTIRTAEYEGKNCVIVPVIALVEGVIWPINAPAPEFVPGETFSLVPQGWNGRPVFADLGHPTNADGQQVSGNSPRVLETSIGTVFNAQSDGKRLTMEAWLDPTKPAAQAIIDRVNNGQMVEVSVGAFVVNESTTGMFEGKKYDGIWREIIPDHLALLPEGDEGACSAAMGCGIRAAQYRVHLVMNTSHKTEGQMEEIVLKALTAYLKTDPFKEIHICGDGVVVYETAGGKMYRQSYDASGVLQEDGIEVEPVMYYQPVDLKDAKGAKYSKETSAKIQSMHNYTVEMGAECTPKAATAKPPCGCHNTQELTMARTAEQRTELIKNLRTKIKAEILAKLEAAAKGGSDLVDAIIAQIKDKLGLSDAAAADLANLAETTIVELAGMTAATPADGNKPADGGTPPPPAAAKAKTEAEILAEYPSIKAVVDAAKTRDAARSTELVKVLKSTQTEFNEVELKAMSVSELERLARACKAAVPVVDFSVNAPRAEGETKEEAPKPINMTERILAARGVVKK